VDYHELSKMTVGKLREMAQEYEDLVGVTAMSKEKLIAELCQRLGIEMPHKIASGIDKTAVKGRIRELKKLRDHALADKDHATYKKTLAEIHKLRHQLRRAIHVTAG